MTWNDEIGWKPDYDLGAPHALHADTKALVYLEVREISPRFSDYRVRVKLGELLTDIHPGAIYRSREEAGAVYWAALHTIDALRRIDAAKDLQALDWEAKP
jgi:hypothetical protein